MIFALAFLILPWAFGRIEDLRDKFDKRGDIARIEPGQFQESANGDRVFFIEKDTARQDVGNNVFIATRESGKETITSAKSGRVENIRGEKFLVLDNGQRLEKSSSKGDVSVSVFKQYGTRISNDAASVRDYVPLSATPSWDLARSPTAPQLAELSWRAGLTLAALNFIIIGIASAGVNPRVGRTGNLAFAFLTFVVYFNMLVLGKSWVAEGKVQAGFFLVALHGGALLLALAWLAKRHNNWTLRWFRSKRAVRTERKP